MAVWPALFSLYRHQLQVTLSMNQRNLAATHVSWPLTSPPPTEVAAPGRGKPEQVNAQQFGTWRAGDPSLKTSTQTRHITAPLLVGSSDDGPSLGSAYEMSN